MRSDTRSKGGSRIDENEHRSEGGNCGGEAAEPAGDGRSEWLRKLDEECPYQVVLPRGPGDAEIMNFLNAYVGKFDMSVEDEYAVFVRYCFADPLDAAIFRSRFEFKSSRLRLAG